MLQVPFIRENKDLIRKALYKRAWDDDRLVILDDIVTLDDERKTIQTSLDSILSEINSTSKSIGDLFKSGKQEEANELKSKVQQLKEKSSSLEEQSKTNKEALQQLLFQVPNVPNELVPSGSTEEDNEVYKDLEGALPDLGADAKPHWELVEDYKMIDFKRGVKITGAGFPLYTGKGAKLQRSLVQFFLNEAEAAGYTEVNPPFIVNEESGRGTGQLPDKEGQMYAVPLDKFYLIPTAEVPVTNIHRGSC